MHEIYVDIIYNKINIIFDQERRPIRPIQKKKKKHCWSTHTLIYNTPPRLEKSKHA